MKRGPGDGGGRGKGQGRKKGVPNRFSREDRERADASGDLPLPVILKVMRARSRRLDLLRKKKGVSQAELIDAEDLTLAAAEKAAPFLHHKLQSVAMEPLDLSQLTDEELKTVRALKQRLGSPAGPAVH